MNSVLPLRDARDASQFGGKATNLAKLLQAAIPVPDGIAVGLDAFKEDGYLEEVAQTAIKNSLDPSKEYAVRSSALAEDAEGASWAGQFETFLNTPADQVIAKVEECHNSAKARARSYASDKQTGEDFDIAVVVQEMLHPEYAGVLFTKDPLTGKDNAVTEYVEGLGEELVSGRADPKRVILQSEDAANVPFDASQLAELAQKTERLFGVPQDIEWVWADGKIWLVQARPITVTQKAKTGYYLGESEDLFYWGPSRAKALYMSDFMAAAERLFVQMANDQNLPTPPKTLVLFDEGKMVWLNNAAAFNDFTERTFETYAKQNRLSQDIAAWKSIADRLPALKGEEFQVAIFEAWYATEFAEFALYGAETALIKKLSRFDDKTRQEIWGAFTVPDKPTFLNRIDDELITSQNPAELAEKYPWIQDGYNGLSDTAAAYFEERLRVVGDDPLEMPDHSQKRLDLTRQLGLANDEVIDLTLARELAEFMDDRKAWMMQTRRLLDEPVSNFEHGWFFSEGKSEPLDSDAAHELWQRYVNFKASTSAVRGIVASNGGRHFVNGEVVVVGSPTDTVAAGKIIVVPSTSPSYVPLMRKAKALITDHGGMMSHAAIVAREFNLPCIVGTKQATKVLSSGDNVVLDLVTGEVRK